MLGFFKSLRGEQRAAPAKRESAPPFPMRGAAAARECLGLDLGEVVAALLERDTPKSWAPDPTKWEKP